MASWFRFYTEVLDDPKIQKLPNELLKYWLNTLCLTSKCNGALPPLADIAFAFRLDLKRTEEVINDLRQRGLIDKKGNRLAPHNWDQRQYRSDSSTERVKRFRKQKRNVSETADETDQSRTDTEQIQNRTEGEGDLPATERRAGRPDAAYEVFAEAYLTSYKNPYGPEKADWFQLARLRKRLNFSKKDLPPDWNVAVLNFFASPLAEHTLKFFVSRFDTFRNSPLDRFNKPLNHVNSGANGNGKYRSSEEISRINSEVAARFIDGEMA